MVAEAEPLETELLDRVTPLPQTHPKGTKAVMLARHQTQERAVVAQLPQVQMFPQILVVLAVLGELLQFQAHLPPMLAGVEVVRTLALVVQAAQAVAVLAVLLVLME